MKYLLSILLISLCLNKVPSQSTKLDSIIQLVKSAKHDSLLVKHYIYLSKKHRNKDINQALVYSKKSLEIAEEIGFDRLIGLCDFEIGANSFKLSKSDDALAYARKGVIAALKSKQVKTLASLYKLLGYIYEQTYEYDSSLYYTELGVKILKDNNITKGLGSGYYSLGAKFMVRQDPKVAAKYFRLALSYAIQYKKKSLQSTILGSLATVTDSIHYAYKCIKIAKEIKNYESVSISYGAIADILKKKGALKEAIQNLEEAYTWAVKSASPYVISTTLLSLGEYNIADNNMDTAKVFLEQSLALAKEYKILDVLEYGNTFLSEIYQKEGNYEKAFIHLNKIVTIKDSLINNSFGQNSAKFDAKFKTAQKEKEIAQQKLQIAEEKNAKFNILLGGILALLLASGIYLWYYLRYKRKKQEAEQALIIEQEKAANIRELDQLKDQFFTNISHELRTPLTLITDPLGKVLQKPISSLDKEDIALAHKNSQKLLGLINEIMNLSKLDAGKVKLKKSTIHINNAMRRLLMSFESLAHIRDINLIFDTKINDDLMISTDYKMLEKIINNLVSNALKFSNDQGNITMSVSKQHDQCVIKIKDDGQGISTEEQKHIFDRFYQGAQTSYQGGTGVGLALSKQLSQLMNADLTVESEQGKGSIFTLKLPLSDIQSVPQSIEEQGTEEQPIFASLTINGEKPKILIIEDNEDMSNYLCKIMSDSYQCTKALNGMEAIKSMQKDKFELILSDVMMPGMDGFELRKKSMQIFKNEAIPYVFLTARSLEDDILQGLRLGVDDYITKPFNSDELKARIHNLIKNKINRDQWNATEGKTDKSLDDAEDIRFIKEVEKVIFNHMSDLNYNVESLAKDVALSTRQLGRKIKSITGLTPVAFILEMRLQKARQMIERKTYNNTNDIRYEIGINSNSYFSKKYKERFGVSPSELLK